MTDECFAVFLVGTLICSVLGFLVGSLVTYQRCTATLERRLGSQRDRVREWRHE